LLLFLFYAFKSVQITFNKKSVLRVYLCWVRWFFNMYITCGPSAVDPLSILLFTLICVNPLLSSSCFSYRSFDGCWGTIKWQLVDRPGVIEYIRSYSWHTTKWPKETRGHPLYVFCLLAMVLCVFETHEPNSKTSMTSRYSK
jgi:hypothetical protein